LVTLQCLCYPTLLQLVLPLSILLCPPSELYVLHATPILKNIFSSCHLHKESHPHSHVKFKFFMTKSSLILFLLCLYTCLTLQSLYSFKTTISKLICSCSLEFPSQYLIFIYVWA
jgi:hypothetical protein